MRLASVEDAVKALRGGGVALVPTDTVVGLVASEAGLAHLAGLKGRDPDKPIAVLCNSPQEAFSLAREVPPVAKDLARRYWPGPLTLVLRAAASDGTVGVRVPDSSTVRNLLAAYGGPLNATSANPAGEPAPQALDGVDPDLQSAVDVVVDGAAGSGEASAVVDLSEDVARLLRPTAELTEEVLLRMTQQRESE